MNSNHSKFVTDLGSALLSLIAIEPKNREEIAIWKEKSTEVSRLAAQLESGGISVPELVYHFLSDADIRVKDPRYADIQMARIQKVGLLLASGVIAGADEI